jgi:glucose-1-phosphate thymidylyltransferase
MCATPNRRASSRETSFQEDLRPYLDAYERQEKGAKVLLKEVSLEDARRFGVAHIEEGRLARVEEKPGQPTSTLVVTGCYLYDARVFDLIRLLIPSERGELEVSDLNNLYIEEGTMTFDVLKGWWTDAGTPASKLKASILVALAKGVTFHA